MRLLQADDALLTLQLSVGELYIISNALNEVCNGIDVPEFRARIGASIDEVRTLLGVVGDVVRVVEKR
jgi:hypothetical protein